MKRKLPILAALLFCGSLYAQPTGPKGEIGQERVEIYFEHDRYLVDESVGDNARAIEKLSDVIDKLQRDTLVTIKQISVNSYTSPEGATSYNTKLSEKRSRALANYLTQYFGVDKSLIDSKSSGVNWDEFRKVVAESDLEQREKLLEIIDNVPEETWKRVNPNDRWLTLVDSRNKHILDIDGGKTYRYMFNEIYPKLRRGSVVTVYFQAKAAPAVAPKQEPKEEVAIPEPAPQITEEPAAVIPPVVPLFAIKTNLLFDIATLINIELEVPIGDRWSVAGEWIFPWWTSCGRKANDWQKDSNRNTLEILNGNIEGKYWFGDRSSRPVMTGWHLGIYAGAGLYDLERRAEGYKGDFLISAGLSGGYAHTINKSGSLRMEYSLGVGYMQTDYDKYAEHLGIDDSWHTIRQESGTYSWIGPTRARVSLVWMLFNRNK